MTIKHSKEKFGMLKKRDHKSFNLFSTASTFQRRRAAVMKKLHRNQMKQKIAATKNTNGIMIMLL